MKDGKIIYFLEEERISRIKNHTISFSDLSFYGIDILKSHVKNIDYLIFSSFGRDGRCYVDQQVLKSWFDIINNFDHKLFSNLFLENNLPNFNDSDSEHDYVIIHSIMKQIESNNIKVKNIIFDDNQHHLYHSYSAFYSSGFNEASCLIMDGGGSFFMEDYQELGFKFPFREKESMYFCSKNADNVENLYTHYSQNFSRHLDFEFIVKQKIQNWEKIFSHSMSCGDLFNFVTCKLLGLNSGDDSGKTMGLSSYFKNDFPSDLKDEWFYEKDDVILSNPKLFEYLYSLTHYEFNLSHNNMYDSSMIAKKLQIETQNYTIKLIERLLEKTKTKNLVLSGGYFLNCVNNYEYRKILPRDINIFVDPIPHDAGTALGSVYHFYKKVTGKNPKPIDHLFLGPKQIKIKINM
jgi:hypothetical protein